MSNPVATSYEHARDIDDRDFLLAVQSAASSRGFEYATRWDVSRVLGGLPADGDVEPGAPAKVVLAKAKRLIRRGLLGGCPCGCRGDFWLTPAGMAFVDG